MAHPQPPSSPEVHFPPPFLFIAGLAGGWLLDRHVLALAVSYDARPARETIGLALVALGLLLSFWGIVTFRRANTTIIPHRSASRIVTHGPYRFTRNPMYSGLTIAYLGGTALMNSVWPLLLLPLVLFALVHLVVSREERYLSAAFGEEYEAYRTRVRRWL